MTPSPSSPRQNRVDPWSHLVATSARGQLMGNRGCLHNVAGRIVRDYQVTRWIICLLNFRGRHRAIMQPGHYTELVFLDEATALAAGHRPCAECQRERYNLYRDLWAKTHDSSTHPRANDMDTILHAARWQDGRKTTYTARLADLPDGTIIAPSDDDTPYIWWQDQLWQWDFNGYIPLGRSAAIPGGIAAAPQGKGMDHSHDTARLATSTTVRVLTPQPTVAILAAGYPVQVHPSLPAPTAGRP